MNDFLERLWRIASSPADQIVQFLFSQTLFLLAVAVVVVVGLSCARRCRNAPDAAAPRGIAVPASVTQRYLTEYRVLGLSALTVLVAFFVENLLIGIILSLSDVAEWWRYATPIFAAVCMLAIVAVLIVLRGTRRPEAPVISTVRRGWASFSTRAELIVTGGVLLALAATTLWAGLLSSADNRGRFIYISIDVPNTDVSGIRPWFYGWTFGVPVLVSLAALAAITWFVLRSNAVRPYIRPETVLAEQRARASLATSVAHLSSGAILLAFGGALRFIGRSGGPGLLGMTGENGEEMTYETSWAGEQFAEVAAWLAPVLQIVGFALLLIVAWRMLRARDLTSPRGVSATNAASDAGTAGDSVASAHAVVSGTIR